MSNASSHSQGAALIEQFAQRVATRDQPLAPRPEDFSPERILERIAHAVAQRLHQRDPRRQRHLAALLYCLIQAPSCTTPQLTAQCGLHRQVVSQLAHLLMGAGLVERGRQHPLYWYRLSRAGEDWLLPIVKNEAPAI